MFRWYERSQFCVVYLEDLPAQGTLDIDLPRCRWFTRGWTLQELIAPNDVRFYDRDWNYRGSKRDLVDRLTEITQIDQAVLLKHRPLSSVIVARKFSWAAQRQTTRIEDIAYCLLGLFDINMPLLYGEEEKAFRRLQIEIINTTHDLSIFAWRSPLPTYGGVRPAGRVYSGLLAKSPLPFFQSSYDVCPFSSARQDFLVTNIGIKTKIPLFRQEIPGKLGSRYLFPLGCCGSSGVSLGIRLRKCGYDQFVRDDPFDVLELGSGLFTRPPREIYLLIRLPGEQLGLDSSAGSDPNSNFSIARSRSNVLQVQLLDMGMYDAWPWNCYDHEDQLFFIQGDTARDLAVLRFMASFVYERKYRISVNLECMCFASGWSVTTGTALQCSIVEYWQYATALNDIQSRIVELEPGRNWLIQLLKHHRIPRSSAAAIKIPGTDLSTLVWLKPTLVKNADICINEFWRLQVLYQVLEDKDLPKIPSEEWIFT